MQEKLENIYTVPSSVMEVNRISKQTLGSYRFACLFPLLACPMLTMILHNARTIQFDRVCFR